MAILSKEHLLNKLLFGGGGGLKIKSIQYGTSSINPAATTRDVTLDTPVVFEKSICLYLGYITEASLQKYKPLVQLIDGSTVRITLGDEGSNTYPVTVSYVIIEFETGVKSIQRGVFTTSDNLNSTEYVTLATPVDVKKAIPLFNGSITADTDTMKKLCMINSISGPSTLVIQKRGMGMNFTGGTIAYTILELE